MAAISKAMTDKTVFKVKPNGNLETEKPTTGMLNKFSRKVINTHN